MRGQIPDVNKSCASTDKELGGLNVLLLRDEVGTGATITQAQVQQLQQQQQIAQQQAQQIAAQAQQQVG